MNRDDRYFEYLEKKAKTKNLKVVSFGISRKSNIYPVKIIKDKTESRLTIRLKKQIITLTIKNINIYNVLCSLAL